MSLKPQTVLVTGAGGLLGFHVRSLLLARNGERAFKGEPAAFEIRKASTADFRSSSRLASLVSGCDIVLHLAGVNRASPEHVEQANKDISDLLVRALSDTESSAHVVYANTTHAGSDTPYGRGKQYASEALARWAASSGAKYSDIVLPHLFGEGGVPNYNTVTATLCEHLNKGTAPTINEGAKVELLHAGEAADILLSAGLAAEGVCMRAQGEHMMVSALYKLLQQFYQNRASNLFPDLSKKLNLQLYNTLRFSTAGLESAQELTLNTDARGELFEVARGGGGGQTFLSWTKPGVVRGNHFHRRKVERFVVLQGQADIHLRKVFTDKVHTYSVTGDSPLAVDIPTLHTHSIVNTGDAPLLTLFWVHETFDPMDTDTYMHPVQEPRNLV